MKQSDGSGRLWSLQAVVAIVFTVIVLAISGSLIGFNHAQLTKLTLRDAEEDFRRIVDNVRGEVSGGFRIAGSVLDTISLTVDPNQPLDALAPRLLTILTDLERSLPAAVGLFVGRGDGSHVLVQSLSGGIPPEIGKPVAGAAYAYKLVEQQPAGAIARWIVVDRTGHELQRIPPQPTTFDPRQRPWYEPSVASDGSIVTPPYRFASVPEAGITMAHRAEQRDDAVFGIDMTLASLDQYLERLRFPPELELLIFDDTGTLIAHPHGNSYRQILQADKEARLLKVTDLNAPLLRSMYANFQGLGGRVENVSFDVGDQNYFGRTERVGDGFGNLFISLAVPYETLLGPAEQLRSQLLLISAASVALALLVVVLTARRLSRPLQVAAEDIRRIMRFEFGHPARPQPRVFEIQQLRRAIDTLELALSTFMRYVPRALVQGIIGRTFSSELGGKRQPITVLFSDIAGFTTLAEELDPEDVMMRTSRYFSDVGSELLRSGATIDKYIGDSIMAFWNAPEEREDHVSLGCLGALRAARRLDRLNEQFIAEGSLPMRTRFGLHTGEAVVGNVGSVDRVNYTALGHTVNMASRLEKLNKRYGTIILVSETVRAAAGEHYVFRFVDNVVPEGAHKAMAVFELLGVAHEGEPELQPSDERLRTLKAWEAACASYDSGDLEKAAAQLDALIESAPDDLLFRIYLERCRATLREEEKRS
ncbi:adenylate/guanylate cyclase domain-containing protein [Microvirga flavescens]|uniref:adenylate/guanylate cyclase domain-containing protein n=1 Tax=Microvirga flavescens TaxID=2249811 RepID=UPI000DD60DB5|nr:adenylate/guanylate cyclase domain-containing protein [Microvirga flavescens]